jgi:hypothetical protein
VARHCRRRPKMKGRRSECSGQDEWVAWPKMNRLRGDDESASRKNGWHGGDESAGRKNGWHGGDESAGQKLMGGAAMMKAPAKNEWVARG